ncbi:hypothetical protein N7499_001737 [Penicillium canescens]|uniref:3-oxoacyl-[acyl-carrier-protein] reductase n=1 Tax=Penicillium canescens TaxID=5083 RepID=A0AAD6I5Z1_PENCN|nr:uncharacterized protein N7446_009281 [Penicillium canescens]KAJ5981250.1 hypothetical protein N7522_013671 [Penicillium canescens]KAJ6034532.1 hypothetical protein N7460_008707 [Penicillium canescens]KAJ6046191.1 hypothetical protein N7444_007445 [Penicillium canescens]KAJ6053269.1 hypothetical protein N7446_009281 [Penicillium canescens]KAJ6097363.1 hypothetical protein N7499_001737 [Penicillium canescens]
MSNKTLAGKVAIITGASRGIGAAISLKLAHQGANIALNYKSNANAAEQVAKEIRTLGVRAITLKADVSQQEEVKAMFEAAQKEFGRLDIVVSNSGIEHFADIADVKGEDIDAVFAVNVKGQFFVAQQAYKYMEDFGRVMLTSSISAVKGVPRHAVYAASKAAVQGMTKCLAVDFGSRNITVNCIAAGGVKTDMYTEMSAKYIPGGDKMSPQQIEELLSKWSPLGRVGEVEDVAGVAALIASPDSQWLTGQTWQVSGGSYMV